LLKTVKSIYNSHIRGDGCEHVIVMLSVISIFLPFYITAVVVAAISIRALVLKNRRKEIFAGIDGKLIVAFALINIAAPIVFKNYLGVACFFGVVLILVYALYLRSVMNKSLFEKAADVMAFMSITSAVVALLQRLSGVGRTPSVFFNPNYYGAIITMVSLICLYRLIIKRGNPVFLLFSLALNALGLLLCNCQSAFFSIALGVFVLLLITKKYKIVIAFVALGLVCLPLLPYILPRLSGAFENISIRATIWNAGLKGFLETPFFGRGMMGYMQIFEKFGGQKNFHCHNMFIDLLLSFGVVGVVPLIWFVLRPVIKAFKEKSPVFISVLAAVLLHSLTDVTLAFVQTGALAAVLVAIPYLDENKKNG